MIQQRLVADVDLIPLQHRRHGDDHGKFLGIALEVVGHGQHGLVVLPHEDDLRRLVEQLRVRLSHVETAEGEQRLARPGERDDQAAARVIRFMGQPRMGRNTGFGAGGGVSGVVG